MKYKNLAVILAVSSLGFSAINGVAHAEEVGTLSQLPQ